MCRPRTTNRQGSLDRFALAASTFNGSAAATPCQTRLAIPTIALFVFDRTGGDSHPGCLI
jgi:hypothetical protein